MSDTPEHPEYVEYAKAAPLPGPIPDRTAIARQDQAWAAYKDAYALAVHFPAVKSFRLAVERWDELMDLMGVPPEARP